MQERLFGQEINVMHDEYAFVFRETMTWDYNWRVFVRCYKYDKAKLDFIDAPVIGWYDENKKLIVFPLNKKSIPKNIIKIISEFFIEYFCQ